MIELTITPNSAYQTEITSFAYWSEYVTVTMSNVDDGEDIDFIWDDATQGKV